MGDVGRVWWSVATPTSRPGAIALVWLRGDVAGGLARLGIAPVEPGGMRVRMLAGIDRGLVARLGDDQAMLMPHGGLAVLSRIAAWLQSSGIEADPGTECGFWEARSPFEARLLRTLAGAASPLAIDLLLDQERRWRAWSGALPEASTPAPDAAHSHLLDRLLSPPLIVAIGASNIGKSTLLNGLAGREVAAVADEPGTTRDHVGAMLDLDGLVARYVDAPGVRAGASALEVTAWEVVEALLPSADLVLLLGDAGSAPLARPDGAPAVRIALRRDLGPPRWEAEAEVSAATGQGVPELAGLLRERLVPRAALDSPLPWRFWTGP